MSDNVSPSAYNAPGALAPESDNFNCQFRLLLMRVFMDNLGKEQVLKFHFLCRMPEKLRDHEANSSEFRFEILKYVEHQLMHEWTRTPSSLQTLLVDVGRTDLSLELGQLVGKCEKSAFFFGMKLLQTLCFFRKLRYSSFNIYLVGELMLLVRRIHANLFTPAHVYR